MAKQKPKREDDGEATSSPPPKTASIENPPLPPKPTIQRCYFCGFPSSILEPIQTYQGPAVCTVPITRLVCPLCHDSPVVSLITHPRAAATTEDLIRTLHYITNLITVSHPLS